MRTADRKHISIVKISGLFCKLCDWMVRLMYWLLTFAPFIIEMMLGVYSLMEPSTYCSPIVNCAMWGWALLGRQIYLLLINYIYIKRYAVTYVTGLLIAICIICLNVGGILILHKIEYGVFIGDVLEGIYYLLIGIPTVIIVIGMGIMYFIRKL